MPAKIVDLPSAELGVGIVESDRSMPHCEKYAVSTEPASRFHLTICYVETASVIVHTSAACVDREYCADYESLYDTSDLPFEAAAQAARRNIPGRVAAVRNLRYAAADADRRVRTDSK